MCGRYALSLRPSYVRQRLADQDMYVDEAPDDDDQRIRQTYNFAPGYHGLIYRASTGDHGGDNDETTTVDDGEPARKRVKTTHTSVDGRATKETKYKLQAARWGLIPFWTKRAPDYSSQLKTINCRDDSLIENRGMWNTMKQRKRCIVVAEGFYEWLKKNNGKEKIPHFTKRKDGELMCFAGLWDMVQYEDSEEKLYTYTIITTDSNQQLKFLHDRMPVLLEPGSEAMKMWLDPQNVGWSKELQNLLKPYTGELDCYPVDKDVGKVGNNSPTFIIPIDSKANKKNIANFFGNQAAKNEEAEKIKIEMIESKTKEETPQKNKDDSRTTTNNVQSTEDNAPIPKPESVTDEKLQHTLDDSLELDEKAVKKEDTDEIDAISPKNPTTSQQLDTPSPVKRSKPKQQTQGSIRKARNATSDMTVVKTPDKDGNAKITNYFGK